MAVYTNMTAVAAGQHGLFESSNLKSTDIGNLYDAIVRNGSSVAIDVDNGVGIKVGEYTGDGLQTRYATIAANGDKIAVTGSPAVVKDAMTKAQGDERNFYHKAGTVAKAYEVVEDDIFAVAGYQITSGTAAVGSWVTVDATGGWKVTTGTMPTAATYGFIGKIHSIYTNGDVSMVRIRCIQNVQN